MNQVPRGRGQLLLLAALFFGPLLAAVLLYFAFPQWQPQGRTNYGELLRPARPLPAVELRDVDGRPAGPDALRGRWTWLYLGAGTCDAACGEKLYQFRQIRTLLNEKRERVQRVYLAPDAAALPALQEQLARLHPDLRIYAEAAATQPLRRFIAAQAAPDPRAVYLVDPLGNWLMIYPGTAESKGVLQDIKKLLSVSQIG